jgi:hypothetical protein
LWCLRAYEKSVFVDVFTGALGDYSPPYIKELCIVPREAPWIDPSIGFCNDWLLGSKYAVCQENLTKNLRCKLFLSRNLDKNVFIAKKRSIKQGLPVKKKALTIATVTVVSLLVTALFVYSQISELQNQISKLQAQNEELQD